VPAAVPPNQSRRHTCSLELCPAHHAGLCIGHRSNAVWNLHTPQRDADSGSPEARFVKLWMTGPVPEQVWTWLRRAGMTPTTATAA
jgi:hypothetical protein